MSLKELCGDIRNREIVLYGNSEEIRAFLNTYQKLLHIKCVVTDYMEEVKMQPYTAWGVETCLLETESLQKELIIICERNEFVTLKLRLAHMGKREYSDYISYLLTDSLLFGKKMIVCMGTQLIEQVCLFLVRTREVTDVCSIQYFAESDMLAEYKNRLQEHAHLSRLCDVYIRSSCEKELFRLKVMKESDLKSDCKVVTVSDYGFGGYFPQISRDRDLYSDYMMRERLRLDMSYETMFFSRTDRELEKLCKSNTDTEGIVEQITDETFYSEAAVKKYFDEEIMRYKELEASDDIKLGEFIEQHRAECLCRNLNEWNEPVVSYVTEKLLALLGLPMLTMETEERKRLIEENTGSEILVYPSVRKALNLDEGLRDKKYRVTAYYSTRYMTENEYACYMAEYLKKVLELMEFTGTENS